MFWVIFIATIVVIVGLALVANRAKQKKLVGAPQGSTRVETVKASQVNSTVKQYAAAGWTVEDQSTAKSFGSQARVTITFRKP